MRVLWSTLPDGKYRRDRVYDLKFGMVGKVI